MSHTFVLRTTIKYWTQVLHNQHGLVHAWTFVHTHFFIKMSHTIRTAHNNKNVERVFAQPTRQKMFFVTRSKKIYAGACNCCHGGTRIYQNRICLTNHTLGENKSCNFCTFECCTICTIEFCTICTFLLDFDRSMEKCLQINGDGYLEDISIVEIPPTLPPALPPALPPCIFSALSDKTHFSHYFLRETQILSADYQWASIFSWTIREDFFLNEKIHFDRKLPLPRFQILIWKIFPRG